ncbi:MULTISPECIES: cytochrome oxidase small assembly protein [Cupriavidus]|nr:MULTISPECIES: cytochrome oxidase small assembly protein [Cupriavidus]MDE4916574.1 cytochrome oxidase small assembly protein [Cupriavidus metallidurans]QWC88901.1 cytochrome oxidase small assembly protein [Cupriavidus metallidurans]UBM11290.1 cytochrome oxidase small assembly protein [Cupriavidus metallidurans]
MQPSETSPSPQDRKAAQRAANRRLGWILLSIVVVFFLGFFAKMVFLGG